MRRARDQQAIEQEKLDEQVDALPTQLAIQKTRNDELSMKKLSPVSHSDTHCLLSLICCTAGDAHFCAGSCPQEDRRSASQTHVVAVPSAFMLTASNATSLFQTCAQHHGYGLRRSNCGGVSEVKEKRGAGSARCGENISSWWRVACCGSPATLLWQLPRMTPRIGAPYDAPYWRPVLAPRIGAPYDAPYDAPYGAPYEKTLQNK
eukprot:4965401-Amphidinium_carterae.2